MTNIKKVLFLCTGNSCRSQMAEAIVNARYKDTWRAYSAGTSPEGYVHPNVLQVLEEIGIHHRGISKHTDQVKNISFDLVITVCSKAAENCPAWLGEGQVMHLSFDDPAEITGSDEEITAGFRRVREEIDNKLTKILRMIDNPDLP